MSALQNARHEKFAQAVFAGTPATQAWLAVNPKATYQSAAVTAARTLQNAKVQARIAELQSKALAKAEITAEMIANEAWAIATDSENGPGPRVSALALLAKRHPEFSEKHEVSGDIRLRVEALAAVANLSSDELKALAQRART